MHKNNSRIDENMMESISKFIAFIQKTNPRFQIRVPEQTSYEKMVQDYEEGDPGTLQTMRLVLPEGITPEQELEKWRQYAKDERAQIRPVVSIEHILEPSPNQSALSDFAKIAEKASPELFDFYNKHDGARLFIDKEYSDNPGLYFYPLSEMADEKDGLEPWLEMLEEDEYLEEEVDGNLEIIGIPEWMDSSLVFGGIGLAAERLIIPLSGSYSGHVFIFEHDPLGFRLLEKSFGSFLNKIRNEPCSTVEQLGLDYLYDAEHFKTDA